LTNYHCGKTFWLIGDVSRRSTKGHHQDNSHQFGKEEISMRTPSKEEREALIAELKAAVEEEGYDPVDDPIEADETPENVAVFLKKKEK
jgi:hypothetical protein